MIDKPATIQNKTFDEISPGDTASLTRTLSLRDIKLFAIVTEDMNPAHLDPAYASTDIFHGIVGHGMWTGSLFSALLGMHLPGPGTVYLSQTLKFLHPVRPGEAVTATVTAVSKDATKKHITFSTLCINSKNERLVEGEAVVLAPLEHISLQPVKLPTIEFREA
jgi:phosphate acetyltransferase